MSSKFQCHYRLNISWKEENGQPQLYTVTDPVTIQFNVTKATFQSNNSARIVVTNMDGAVREAIYQDRLLYDISVRKMVTLEAGYGDRLAMVCLGWISECYSERNGVDVQTIIDVIDPDILTEYCSVTFEPGTSFEEAFKYLASQMPNLKIGEMGQLQGEFQVPTVFDGNTFVAINKLTGQHTFIDNGKLNNLNDNETLTDYDAYLLEDETGMLDAPKRRGAMLEINMLFEPSLRIGQMVEIKSKTSTGYRFNGQYKIQGMTHDCTISGSEGGTRRTILYLQYINFLTNSNVNLTQNPAGSPPSKVINNKVEPLNTKVSAGVNQVFKYVMDNAGKIPSLAINSIITWADMIGHNNKPNERVSDLTKGKLANCESVANRLMQFRDTYFSGKTITITSGWRSIANNNREGGVSNSQHLYGRAIDFKISGVSASTVASVAKKSKMFSYVKPYSTWTHVDVRS